jgi:predicted naringenin-chalcone synthase
LSKIISIATSVPQFRHQQEDILHFMQGVYAMPDTEKRKMRFLYHHSGIDIRYSVISDYSRPMSEWKFYPQTENLEPFPSLELRMAWYQKHAPLLSVEAIRKCLDHKTREEDITHLITVSCTGMSAPGLDLQVMELMDLPNNIYRTSVNFMGCYAAIHALKMGDMICRTEKNAKVLIVCTELCTLHFQRSASIDNIASSLLFADGAAAVLMTSDEHPAKGIRLDNFYGEVVPKGKKDMAWELSSTGFLMTLSGYVPDLISEDIEPLVQRALQNNNLSQKDITHWCIHPGGRKILETVSSCLKLQPEDLSHSYQVLRHFGNMSSPTILFVLKDMLHQLNYQKPNHIFGLAFGPGLTMETFMASTSAS